MISPEVEKGLRISRDRIVPGSYAYWRYSLDYFLDTAANLGVSYVELWAAAPHIWLGPSGPVPLAPLKRKLRERGLKVWCVTPEQVNYPVNLAAEDEALREDSVNYFRRAIDVASDLECGHVLTTAGCGYFDKDPVEAWNWSRESLSRLAEYARERGVELWLETLTPMSSNVLNTPQQQRKMIASLPEATTYPILDIGQMVHMKQDLQDYLDHGENLVHVHLHDSNPAIHMALGDGRLPIASYLQRLEESGYKGRYAFEFNDARYRFDPRGADIRSMKWLEDQGLIL